MFTLLQIALGGAAGSVLRYLAVSVTPTPWGTALVNVAGSFVMGALFVLYGKHPLLMTGLLGGFTTFSAFSLDTLTLVQAGRLSEAALYAAGSVLLSLAAVALGVALIQRIAA